MRPIICDRCGARITKDTGHISTWFEVSGNAHANNEFHDWDFCPDCMEEIKEYIKTPIQFTTPDEGGAIAEELEEELDIESGDAPISEPISESLDELKDEPKEDKDAALAKQYAKQEKKAEAAGPDALKHGNWLKRADWGKFRACVAAGKDDAWLAVEFGVTTRTIWNWKKKLKEMDETEQTK